LSRWPFSRRLLLKLSRNGVPEFSKMAKLFYTDQMGDTKVSSEW
jgi:hypothetical protein